MCESPPSCHDLYKLYRQKWFVYDKKDRALLIKLTGKIMTFPLEHQKGFILAKISKIQRVRHGQELSYRLRARKKRIVPIAMKLTGFDIERLKLIVGDL